jgi:hypothetical protein
MIALSRRRPVSITVFGVLFLASALVIYAEHMLDLSGEQRVLQRIYPWFTWSRDAVIVWFSAWLSIALIPIAMVWLSAVRFARWLVTIFAGVKLLGLVVLGANEPRNLFILPTIALVSLLLQVAAVALLFTPASHRWFRDKGGADPAVFE